MTLRLKVQSFLDPLTDFAQGRLLSGSGRQPKSLSVNHGNSGGTGRHTQINEPHHGVGKYQGRRDVADQHGNCDQETDFDRWKLCSFSLSVRVIREELKQLTEHDRGYVTEEQADQSPGHQIGNTALVGTKVGAHQRGCLVGLFALGEFTFPGSRDALVIRMSQEVIRHCVLKILAFKGTSGTDIDDPLHVMVGNTREEVGLLAGT